MPPLSETPALPTCWTSTGEPCCTQGHGSRELWKPGRGHTRGQPGSGCRSTRRLCPGSLHRRSAGSPSTAESSAGTARLTSCPGRCLCGWTVRRAQSVCKGQSDVRATSGQDAPVSLPMGVELARRWVGWTQMVQPYPRSCVHPPQLKPGPWEASGVNRSPPLPPNPQTAHWGHRGGKMGRPWGMRSPHPPSSQPLGSPALGTCVRVFSLF